MIVVLLFARETKGLLNGIVSNNVCGIIMVISLITAIATVAFQILLGKGVFDKFIDEKKNEVKIKYSVIHYTKGLSKKSF
jgi:hypothetical protein